MSDAFRPSDSPERDELALRASAGNTDAADGLRLLDAATELVERTSTAVSDALAIAAASTSQPTAPTRPTAAQVAARRPATAEPKIETHKAELVTITASGARAPLADTIDTFTRSFENIAGNKSGKEYVLAFESEGAYKLTRDDPTGNAAILSTAFIETQQARKEQRALTAAFCAPAEPLYDQWSLVSSDNAGGVELPTIEAPRGAVKVAPALTVQSLVDQTGMGVPWTEGSKTCFSFDCVDALEFATTATYSCFSFPNAVYLYWPERVAAILNQSRAVHAASVNEQLIAAIETAAVSYGAIGSGGGATVRIYQNLSLTATWLRQKYQAPIDSFVDVLAPAWVRGVLEADLVARDSVTDPGYGLSRWTESLRRLGINVQWVYNYQENLSAPSAPGSANFLMFFSGSVARLRGRELSLGPIFDSTTNALNRAGFFAETWDGIATSGPEIVELVGVDTCPSGETAPRATEIVCEVS